MGGGGELVVSHVADRFGTEIETTGQGLDRYCLGMMLGGPGGAAQARGGQGLVVHGGPGTRFLTGDGNARLNLWVDARRVERAASANGRPAPCAAPVTGKTRLCIPVQMPQARRLDPLQVRMIRDQRDG